MEDIITRIDDTEVTNSGDLRRVLRGHLPGDTVTLIGQCGERSVTFNARRAEAETR